MNLIHLHPMLVHFPIALTLTALLFEIVNYRFRREWLMRSSVTLTVLAALGAVAAILSGFFLTKPVAGFAAALKELHMTYAVISTILLLAAACAGLAIVFGSGRPRWMRYAFTFFLLLAAVGISITGMEGGSIVYDVWLF